MKSDKMSSFTYTISKGGTVYTAEEFIGKLEKEKADDDISNNFPKSQFYTLFRRVSFEEKVISPNSQKFMKPAPSTDAVGIWELYGKRLYSVSEEIPNKCFSTVSQKF